MFHRFINSPYLSLLCGLVLLVTAGIEIVRELDSPYIGAHHGIFFVGLVQIAKAFPEILHGLKEVTSLSEK